ncbi:hypothetical protein [Rhizobium leguminosarum]|uniref:hypothetical protein n=1 Tax=Rhizobium leguminosarum TaxID=384 RepID=UPI002FF0B2A3
MRKHVIALVGAIALTSCNSVAVMDVATQIIDDIQKNCKFRADRPPILKILTKHLPGLRDVDEIAGAVCDAVTTPTSPGGLSARPTVAGVVVTGKPTRNPPAK